MVELERPFMLLEGPDELLLSRDTLRDTPTFTSAGSDAITSSFPQRAISIKTLKELHASMRNLKSKEPDLEILKYGSIDDYLNIGLTASVS